VCTADKVLRGTSMSTDAGRLPSASSKSARRCGGGARGWAGGPSPCDTSNGGPRVCRQAPSCNPDTASHRRRHGNPQGSPRGAAAGLYTIAAHRRGGSMSSISSRTTFRWSAALRQCRRYTRTGSDQYPHGSESSDPVPWTLPRTLESRALSPDLIRRAQHLRIGWAGPEQTRRRWL
jgi:hypothetical protein